MNKILRTFHPVGQGAFYSERHPDFNIVYDCGNWKDSKDAQKIVNQAFDKNDTIDILFISHFDYDHVSMIGTLRDSVKSIKHVVLPLLYDDEKILLKAFNHLHANSALLNQLIDDPQAFFREDSRVVFVNASENSESPINDNQESINLGNLSANQTIIDSGTKIQLNTSNDWVFIPYNFKYHDRSQQLKDVLNDASLDIGQFDDLKYVEANRADIKECYKKIDGTINENSMIVYSGPLHENHHYYFVAAYYNNLWDWHYLYHRYHHYVDIYDLCHKPACVYSGDADFNKVQIHNIFQRYWKNVGTIQVPHHGSKNSFDFSSGFHKKGCFICPVSFGMNNTYGHPSGKVLEELIQYENIPIAVTEKMDSTFIEIIKC